jgi:ribosomal protein S15P/S13E
MLNWFKKGKKDQTAVQKRAEIVPMKPINYPAKIILAWAKAIEGNDEILLWLKDNGFEELTMATYAILLKDEAREWLPKNGYPQLLAFINAAEGNEKAQRWLFLNDMELLYHMALAIEDEQPSWEWLGQNATADLFLLTRTIKKVKDDIEENHNDIHSFRKD